MQMQAHMAQSQSQRQTPSAPSSQKQLLLRSAEELTMPGVQVIVLSANMRCQECRDRVSKVLSKMDSLLDYVVDVTQKKVTVRGRVDPKKRLQRRMKTLKYERLAAEAAAASSSSSSSSSAKQQQKRCSPNPSSDLVGRAAGCFRCS